MLLECNMILFISLFFYLSSLVKMELFDFSLYYFIFQSIGSIFFLISSCFSNFASLGGSIIIVILSISLKSAIFPFSFWLFLALDSIPSFVLSLLVSVQKIPLYLYLFSLSSEILFFFLLGSFIMGSYYLFGSYSWSTLVLSSSIYSCFWIFCLFSLSNFCFFHFFVLYTFFLLFFANVYYINFFHKSTDSVTCLVLFLFLLGLPPVSMFFFKLYFSYFVFEFFSFVGFFFFWFFVFLTLFGYFKFIYSIFMPYFILFKEFYCNFKVYFFVLSVGIFPQIFF